MAKNQLLIDLKRKYEAKLLANIVAVRETYIQLMTDTLNGVLGDPDIMEDKVFSKEELKDLGIKMNEKYQSYHKAIEDIDENDYYRVKMDEDLKAIFGEDEFVVFENRYDFINKITYTL